MVGAPVEGTLRKVKFYSDLGMTASDGAQCFMYEAYQADFKKRRERSRDRLLPWLKNSPESGAGFAGRSGERIQLMMQRTGLLKL